MSETIASALDKRVIRFVNPIEEYECVICQNVADEPVRCPGLCAGIFCDGCMEKALERSQSCPLCRSDIDESLKDRVLRNQILAKHVYCPNKSDAPSSNKRKGAAKKQKLAPLETCTWTGQYHALRTHLNQCEFEKIPCVNKECRDMIERREFDLHLQACLHRTEQCNHCAEIVKTNAMINHLGQCPKITVTCSCGKQCRRDELTAHVDIECPLVEVQCGVLGCNAMIIRRDYDKHQDEAAAHHVQLVSAALVKVTQENATVLVELGTAKKDIVKGKQDIISLVILRDNNDASIKRYKQN